MAEHGGIRAVAGIPMRADQVPIGAVNLYDSKPRTWTADDLRTADIFADIATGYLVHASAAQQQQTHCRSATTGAEHQVIIEQAKGVLATKRAISVDDAFGRLRKYARDRQERIHDVARNVVNGEILP